MDPLQQSIPARRTITDEEIEKIRRQLVIGFDIARKRVIEMKKQKGTDVVIMRDGKIVFLKPEEWEKEFPRPDAPDTDPHL